MAIRRFLRLIWAATPILGTSLASVNHPLIIVPGLTGSGLEVKEHDAVMPHVFCKRQSDDWMKVWVSPVAWNK